MTTVADVISLARESVLDDNDSQKYLWSNTELIYMLNRAYNELVKLSLIKDQSTTAIMEIKLLSNLGLYALDSRIIQVNSGRLETDTGSLTRTTEARLDATVSDWKNQTGTPREFAPSSATGYLSIYPKFDDTWEYVGASDISFVVATKTISQTGGDFSGLVVGDVVSVSGSGVTANNTTFTVVTVGTTSFTVSETVTVATNTSAIIRKVRDTLLMSVNRLPTARFTVADITLATAITEIRDDHIDGLIDGIAKRAFLKPDTYTYFPNKAEYHRGLFEEFKKEVRRDLILLNKPDRTCVPRSGSSIGY